MKKLILFLALFFASIPAQAKTPWSNSDVDREVLFNVLNVVDAIQTIDCLDRKVCYEANPIYGKHPSTERIIGTKVATGIIHYLIADRMPSKTRKVFQVTSIVVQGGVVAFNARLAF